MLRIYVTGPKMDYYYWNSYGTACVCLPPQSVNTISRAPCTGNACSKPVKAISGAICAPQCGDDSDCTTGKYKISRQWSHFSETRNLSFSPGFRCVRPGSSEDIGSCGISMWLTTLIVATSTFILLIMVCCLCMRIKKKAFERGRREASMANTYPMTQYYV